MDQQFRDIAYLLSCGARGIEPVLDHEIDFNKIQEKAVEQGVWQTVFLPLNQLYKKGAIWVDEITMKNWGTVTQISVLKYGTRTSFMHKIIDDMGKEGISCRVIKGEVMSMLYHNPLCRISGDTDIIIDPADEKRTIEFLKGKGFNCDRRTNHHTCCLHPIGGMLEVHVMFYQQETGDIFFNNMFKPQEAYREIQTADKSRIATLGVTDGAIYIAFHTIRHFIRNGINLRNIMDFLMYFYRYSKEIKWDRFDDIMSELKYDKFIDNIIGVGIEYFNFSEDELRKVSYDKELVSKLMMDIDGYREKAGIDDKVYSIYDYYCKERAKKKSFGQDNKNKKSLAFKKLYLKFFPEKKRMKKEFPYLEKHPAFLFFAYLHRLAILAIRILGRRRKLDENSINNENINEHEIIKERMELIRKLDMI